MRERERENKKSTIENKMAQNVQNGVTITEDKNRNETDTKKENKKEEQGEHEKVA